MGEPEKKTDFFWGVATSAYQAEGGYNGKGEPQTNWAAAERAEQVMPLGRSADFWHRYEEDFERCREMGLNAFRMGIEWSRVQPTFEATGNEAPEFDAGAIEHYAKMIASCRQHGLEPVVTLHHFTHPAWLGPDPWIEGTGVEAFERFVKYAVPEVNRLLVNVHDVEPIHWYITINEPNMLALNSYLGRQFPAKKAPGLHKVSMCCQNLLRAHVRAYDAIHTLYETEGWARPMVSLNNYCSDLYWSDKYWIDLLTAHERKVRAEDIRKEILGAADRFERDFRAAKIPLRKDFPYYIGAAVKRFSNWLGRRIFDEETVRPILEEIQRCGRPSVMDFIGLDYYDPFAAHAFRLPVIWDHEFKSRSFRSWLMNSITSKWWDWRVLPRGLQFFVELWSREYGGRPILIAENGMALRRRPDQSWTKRRDQMTRSEFIKRHVAEVEILRESGYPLVGYLHWSLFDNYEWGSYTPRFGLFSIDFSAGTDRQEEDHFGDRPSETYKKLVAAARAREVRERVK